MKKHKKNRKIRRLREIRESSFQGIAKSVEFVTGEEKSRRRGDTPIKVMKTHDRNSRPTGSKGKRQRIRQGRGHWSYDKRKDKPVTEHPQISLIKYLMEIGERKQAEELLHTLRENPEPKYRPSLERVEALMNEGRLEDAKAEMAAFEAEQERLKQKPLKGEALVRYYRSNGQHYEAMREEAKLRGETFETPPPMGPARVRWMLDRGRLEEAAKLVMILRKRAKA